MVTMRQPTANALTPGSDACVSLIAVLMDTAYVLQDHAERIEPAEWPIDLLSNAAKALHEAASAQEAMKAGILDDGVLRGLNDAELMAARLVD